MKILVVLLYLLCLIILCKKVKGSPNVEEALGSGDGVDDDTEEGEDEQYDYSQNKTATVENDDEYDDVYYEIVEQTETNRFYFLPSSYPPTKKIFLS